MFSSAYFLPSTVVTRSVLSGVGTMSVMPLRIVMVGDSAVGKTSFVVCLRDGLPAPVDHRPTIAVNYVPIQVPHRHGGEPVHIELWDTAGQERYSAMLPFYYRHADAALVMFDVTSRPSFVHVTQWLHQVQTSSQRLQEVALIANKIDLESRAVNSDEGQQLAADHGLVYIETSALTNDNLTLAIQSLLCAIERRAEERQRSQEIKSRTAASISVSQQRTDKRRRCCCR